MKYIASLSGGQDSTAMVVKLLESGQKLDYIIFCDTGNEFPSMYLYLEKLDKYLKDKFDIGITRLSSKSTLKSLCFTEYTRGKNKGVLRGMPFSSSMSFCTRDLKKNVSDRFLKSLDDDCVLYLGYVFREKGRLHISDKNYVTHSYPLVSWKWNEIEVSNYLKEKSLFNDLYKYFTRTGCMFCPKQTLQSWKALYVNFPALYQDAISWEIKANELNAVIPYFRSDYTLTQLAERFKREEKNIQKLDFDMNWNEEDVSCFCK